jgi:hypothetical protein
MFFIDSLQALTDVKAGIAPRGEFARLLDLLTRELAGTAQTRIRRANFLDLVEETLGTAAVASSPCERHEATSPTATTLAAGAGASRAAVASAVARITRRA